MRWAKTIPKLSLHRWKYLIATNFLWIVTQHLFPYNFHSLGYVTEAELSFNTTSIQVLESPTVVYLVRTFILWSSPNLFSILIKNVVSTHIFFSSIIILKYYLGNCTQYFSHNLFSEAHSMHILCTYFSFISKNNTPQLH